MTDTYAEELLIERFLELDGLTKIPMSEMEDSESDDDEDENSEEENSDDESESSDEEDDEYFGSIPQKD